MRLQISQISHQLDDIPSSPSRDGPVLHHHPCYTVFKVTHRQSACMGMSLLRCLVASRRSQGRRRAVPSSSHYFLIAINNNQPSLSLRRVDLQIPSLPAPHFNPRLPPSPHLASPPEPLASPTPKPQPRVVRVSITSRLKMTVHFSLVSKQRAGFPKFQYTVSQFAISIIT